MNYRHIFHAGSFADVHKHAILCVLLQAFRQKDKPFCYIDSHAGIGLYDLTADEVLRNPEYLQGIALLLACETVPDVLRAYLTIVQQTPGHYPGSPRIARAFLESQDTMILNELHPADNQQLRYTMGDDPIVHCHQRDAYEFLPAVLPPNPRRALILIDPPFEQKTEFAELLTLIQQAHQRFPQGCYMIWYPIKTNQHQKFVQAIKQQFANSYVLSELHNQQTEGLTGSGVIVINPPWQTEQTIKQLTTWLSSAMPPKRPGLALQ